MVWVRPWMLPAKVIVAPNSPSARAHASAAPAMSDGRDHRQRDAPEHGPAAGAEGRGRVLVAAVHRPQCGLHGDDEERHGDERLGQDHARRGERELDPEPAVEPPADEAAATERASSATPPTTGGSTIGSTRARARAPVPGNFAAGEHPGERDAEHTDSAGRPERALRARAGRGLRPGRRRSAQKFDPRRALRSRRAAATKKATRRPRGRRRPHERRRRRRPVIAVARRQESERLQHLLPSARCHVLDPSLWRASAFSASSIAAIG